MEIKPFSDISFKAYLGDEKLMSTRCKKCGAISTPQRSLCVECYSTDMEWIELKGTGKLAAFSSINIGVKFMAEQGFDRNNPYCVGVIELDEGTRVNARIVGVDAKNPESIKIGIPMKASFIHVGEGEQRKTFLAFEPV